MKFVALALLSFLLIHNVGAQSISLGSETEKTLLPVECISVHQMVEILSKLDSLRSSKNSNSELPSFKWPIQLNKNYELGGDNNYYAIGNYVDQDPSPEISDYNCGKFTYNGHNGTDIMAWPNGWVKMEGNAVEVVASAPGKILVKNDGEHDYQCSTGDNTPNYIIIEHEDGSTAFYTHFKKNTITTKEIGSQIELGEFLGYVGSSGRSTYPHLHFEIRDKNNNVIDPFHDPDFPNCNESVDNSLWVEQKPYLQPSVSKIFTASQAIGPRPCPVNSGSDENYYFKDTFDFGEEIYVYGAYEGTDIVNYPSYLSLLRPDGSEFRNWQFSCESNPSLCENFGSKFRANLWHWKYIIPSSEQCGTWKFRIEVDDKIYIHEFQIGDVPRINLASDNGLSICSGGTTTLSLDEGYTYMWSGPNEFFSAESSITISDEGVYEVQITSSNNCRVRKSFELIVNERPNVDGIIGNFTPLSNSSESYSIDIYNPTSQYEWTASNGSILSGQGSENVEVEWEKELLGELCVVEIDENACTSLQFCEAINLTSSVDSHSLLELKLFPNPASTMLTIEGINRNQSKTIQIANQVGKKIFVQKEFSGGSTHLDISSLENGIYFMQVNTQRGIEVFKFMKLD